MADKKKTKEAEMENTDLEQASEQVKQANSEDQVSDHPSVESLQEEIIKLSTEKAELHELYLRKHADFENYRKRMSKEKTESIQFANADLIEKMLDVLDNFERAKKAALESNDLATVVAGIDMIEANLISLLSSKGLSKLESVDKPFNPDHHLAIAMEEDEAVQEAVVKEEFQPGYLLHDRLLRTAKVKVSMPKAKAQESSQ